MKFWTWKSSRSTSKFSVWFQGLLKELEKIGSYWQLGAGIGEQKN